ncbi:AraC family transcriptional regulator [Aquisphaera insulae]|uniref:AraC family transcriptional regulator n=1 Tax=Aquisphaera insulae TaxID=2712864 RepID=UPI0013EC47F8|nr:GyrI-like domain-containing protein [Aquisphaera insulae]
MTRSDSLRIYEQRINRVLDRIAADPAAEHSVGSLARVARFSPFHFHRVFRSLVGEPVHAYVRRMRLERAVFRMAHGPKESLTRIALEAGFASSSDFSKAFRQAYGFPPSGFSRRRWLEESKIRQALLPNRGYGFEAEATAESPDGFRVRVVERPAQPIAYVRVIGGFDPEKTMAAHERLMAWARARRLAATSRLLGISPDDPEITPMERYRFDWGLTLPTGERADGDAGVSAGVIAAGRFAVVRCRGDVHMEYRAWTHLFRGWLPRSGYQPTAAPALEWYHRDPTATGWTELDLDCCLPIRPLGR